MRVDHRGFHQPSPPALRSSPATFPAFSKVSPASAACCRLNEWRRSGALKWQAGEDRPTVRLGKAPSLFGNMHIRSATLDRFHPGVRSGTSGGRLSWRPLSFPAAAKLNPFYAEGLPQATANGNRRRGVGVSAPKRWSRLQVLRRRQTFSWGTSPDASDWPSAAPPLRSSPAGPE